MPDPKFLYGSHYSTPGYVLYYLVRVGKKLNMWLTPGRQGQANRPFPSSPGSLYLNEVKCSTFDMEVFFILSHANKTHFHEKGFALGLPIFTENFPRDSWRYIQIKGNVTFLSCCFPHLRSCFCGVWESALSMGWGNCRANETFK